MTQPHESKHKYRIAVLPGDGIGSEVIAEAEKVLGAVSECFGHQFVTESGLVGGAAIDRTGEPLPEATLALCQASDAIQRIFSTHDDAAVTLCEFNVAIRACLTYRAFIDASTSLFLQLDSRKSGVLGKRLCRALLTHLAYNRWEGLLC